MGEYHLFPNVTKNNGRLYLTNIRMCVCVYVCVKIKKGKSEIEFKGAKYAYERKTKKATVRWDRVVISISN